MLTNLPHYSQRDSAWFDAKMGQSPYSLGQMGCTLTASTMAAAAFAKQFNPLVVCRQLSDLGGFDANGNLNWLLLAKVLGLDFGFRWDTDANVAPNHSQVAEADGFRHIEWLANAGIPTVIWVDTDHDGKPNHFCTYIGGGQIIDPWDGQQKSLGDTYKRLYGYAFFLGQPAYATDGKVGVLIGKANEIANGRNVDLNLSELMDSVKRP